MEGYAGKPVSKGYAIGKVLLFSGEQVEVAPDKVRGEDVKKQVERYLNAKSNVISEVGEILNRLRKQGDDKAQIIEAHLSLLDDIAVEEEIQDKIQTEGYNALWAVQEVYGTYIKMMERAKNEIFRERAADFKDVRDRLLCSMAGRRRKRLDMLTEPCIIVCHELMPSDTAGMDRDMVKGIITEVGGDTSHSAIMARSYEIPAVLGVAGVTEILKDGQEVIVDAVEGKVYLNADEESLDLYEKKMKDFQQQAEEVKQYLYADPVTPDGTRVQVMLNIGSLENIEDIRFQSADGVGLFRTEFLYMENDHMPTEDEQVDTYKRVLRAFNEKPVVLRTLDIGGDKTLSYFSLPKEDNPFLGERALRLCFSHPEIFRTQLRAALRASVCGNLWIMFPMVSSIEDIRRAKAALHSAMRELDAEGTPYSKNIKIGVMIEIPSLALIADKVAKEVDFASIGSNDLIQYTMAADRMNQNITDYYQNANPAVLRLIRYAVKCFLAEGKSISLCGELSGSPMTALLLLGMGMRKLSMNFSAVAGIKKWIRALDLHRAEQAVEHVLELETQEAVTSFMQHEFPGV